jgi:hypothetical protein
MSDHAVDPDPSSDTELTDVRATMRAHYRDQQRTVEREAAYCHWSSRTIADVLLEAMRRGDTVTLQLGPHRHITGAVTDAGRDYVIVVNSHERLAARVTDRDGHPYLGPHLLVQIHDRGLTGGVQPTRPQSTFRDILRQSELEAEADPRVHIEVGTTLHSQPVTGRVQALAEDHLYLVDDQGTQTYVPLSTVTYVAARSPGPT